METILLYLLKMFICSGVLYGYYRIALYNERFHQWNRFYLLSALLLSMVVPLVSIPLITNSGSNHFASTISNMPWNAGLAIPDTKTLTWQEVALVSAVVVSVVLLTRIVVQVLQIISAYRSHPVSSLQHNVQLIVTELTHAPFSFFNWLFWRHDIDPASANGQRMLTHELTHISERHSIDKLFTSLLLCLFWINPFFWLIRRELNMIHEFLADRRAIGRQDGAAFAEMILQALPLSQHLNNGLVNPFFSSQIKRRLRMITTSKDPKYNYVRRISGLVLMLGSAFALTVSVQHAEAQRGTKKVVISQLPEGERPDTTYGNISVKGKKGTKMTIKTGNGGLLTIDTIYLDKKPDGKQQVTITGEGTVDGTSEKGNLSFKLETADPFSDRENQPIYILDGKEVAAVKIKSLEPNTIAELNVLKDESAIKKYGQRAKNGVIEIRSRTAEEVKEIPTTVVVKSAASSAPLYYVNGIAVTGEEMQKIKPNDIESVNILKGEAATKKYGEKGKDGVVEITMKRPIT